MFNPNVFNSTHNTEQEIIMNLGAHYSHKAVNKSTDYLRNIIQFIELKPYFDVNNSYVLSKLKLMFFPWVNPFCRMRKYPIDALTPHEISIETQHNSIPVFNSQHKLNEIQMLDHDAPIEKSHNQLHGENPNDSRCFLTNSPCNDTLVGDLYLPLMASLTFTVLVANEQGIKHNSVSFNCFAYNLLLLFVLSVLETLMLYSVQYIFKRAIHMPFLHYLSLSGYKYVPISVIIFIRLITRITEPSNRLLYFLALILGIIHSTFHYLILRDTLTDGGIKSLNIYKSSPKLKLNYFISVKRINLTIFVLAIMQILFIFYFSS